MALSMQLSIGCPLNIASYVGQDAAMLCRRTLCLDMHVLSLCDWTQLNIFHALFQQRGFCHKESLHLCCHSYYLQKVYVEKLGGLHV